MFYSFVGAVVLLFVVLQARACWVRPCNAAVAAKQQPQTQEEEQAKSNSKDAQAQAHDRAPSGSSAPSPRGSLVRVHKLDGAVGCERVAPLGSGRSAPLTSQDSFAV